jgi:hypothetical protein
MSKIPREMGRLSKAERDAVTEMNDPDMIARMEKGDRFEQDGDYFNEGSYHREIQEQLRKNGVYCTDSASLDAYSYNSAVVHNPSYTQYYSSIGYGFDEMFQKNPRTNHYDKILAQQYINDPNTILYHEQSRMANAAAYNAQMHAQAQVQAQAQAQAQAQYFSQSYHHSYPNHYQPNVYYHQNPCMMPYYYG